MLVVLAPVLGIAQSGPQLVATRYTYLSCLGWAILGGGLLSYSLRVGVSVKTRSEKRRGERQRLLPSALAKALTA
jgi:hypothetical protein